MLFSESSVNLLLKTSTVRESAIISCRSSITTNQRARKFIGNFLPSRIFSIPANSLPISMLSPLWPISLPRQPKKLMSMCIPSRRGKNCDSGSGSANSMLANTLYGCWLHVSIVISCRASFVTFSTACIAVNKVDGSDTFYRLKGFRLCWSSIWFHSFVFVSILCCGHCNLG